MAVVDRIDALAAPLCDRIGVELLDVEYEGGVLRLVIDHPDGVGMEAIAAHERDLTAYALRTLADRFGDDLAIHGPATVEADGVVTRGGTLSLAYRDVHPHDLSQVLDQHGVCVRAGHHCAKPLMRELGVTATARASLYLYNDESDVDALVDALDEAARFFAF